ncbi:MAG TPA: erythromycin esterase family protein [Chloroflexota bacterium]|nr:erythromycin esterase family protein [Chloroflexota bacterium]
MLAGDHRRPRGKLRLPPPAQGRHRRLGAGCGPAGALRGRCGGGHLGAQPARVLRRRPPPSQGAYVRDMLGTSYKVVGFAFGRGRVNADSQRHTVDTRQPQGAVDWTLRPQRAAPPVAGCTEELLDRVADELGVEGSALEPARVAALHDAPRARRATGAQQRDLLLGRRTAIP